MERLVTSGGLKEEQTDRELGILLDRLVSSIDEWVVSVPIVNLKTVVSPNCGQVSSNSGLVRSA